MDPDMAMVWCILSSDPTFIGAMEMLLAAAGQEVYAATSWREYERLQQEGAVFEGLVLDPVYRLALRRNTGVDRLFRLPQEALA